MNFMFSHPHLLLYYSWYIDIDHTPAKYSCSGVVYFLTSRAVISDNWSWRPGVVATGKLWLVAGEN